MNKMLTSLFCVALVPSLLYGMKSGDGRRDTNTVEELVVAQENPVKEHLPLCQNIQELAVKLADPKTGLRSVVHGEVRQQLNENYDLLKKIMRDKEARLQALGGYGDDLSEDEELFHSLEPYSEEDVWTAWRQTYESSKHKTDVVIPGLQSKLHALEASHEQVKIQQTEHMQTIASLKKELEEAQAAKRQSRQERVRLATEIKDLKSGIRIQTQRKIQHENFVADAQKEVEDKIKAFEDVIKDFDKGLEQLVFQDDSEYTKEKEALEARKADALKKKKELEAELKQINYYLPKINDPGSTSRQLYSAVASWF